MSQFNVYGVIEDGIDYGDHWVATILALSPTESFPPFRKIGVQGSITFNGVQSVAAIDKVIASGNCQRGRFAFTDTENVIVPGDIDYSLEIMVLGKPVESVGGGFSGEFVFEWDDIQV